MSARHLVDIYGQFLTAAGSEVVASVAFKSYVVASREMLDGRSSSAPAPAPEAEVISIFVTQARQAVDEHNDAVIARLLPDLSNEVRSRQIDTILARLNEQATALAAHVDRRTSLWSALLANLLGWALTVALTLAIIALYLLPSFQDALATALGAP